MKHPAESVFLSFRTQFENLGDCIINLVLISELAKERCVHVLVSQAPSWIIESLRNRSNIFVYASRVAWWRAFATKVFFSKSQVAFHFKPGHHAAQAGTLGYMKSFSRLSFAAICTLFSVKLRIVGASVGDQTRISTFTESIAGRLHTQYGVRDEMSLKQAQHLRIPAVYSPDVAFLLDLNEGKERELRNYMAISFRERPWSRDFVQSSEVSRLLKSIANFREMTDLEPVVVSQVQFDRQFATRIAGALNCHHVEFAQTLDSSTEIFQLYSNTVMVVSNRLHSLIFGWSQGAIPVPVVDSSVDGKIISLFESLGLGELVLMIHEIDHLEEHLQAIYHQRQSLDSRLKLIFENQRRLLREQIKWPGGVPSFEEQAK